MRWLQGVRRPDTTGSGLDRKAPQRGQGMVEYALILVLVAVVVIVALTALGGQIQGVFQHVTSTLSNANH